MLLAAIVVVVAPVVPALAVEKPRVLRLANVVPPTSTKNLACLKFAELVARDTKNAVQVQVFPASQLGNERDLAQGVLMGTVDIFWGDAAAFGAQVKEFNVFNSPFLFRDLNHWNTVVWGPIFDDLVGRLQQKTGAAVLGRMLMGDRYILTRGKPVKSPEDLQGLKIRVPDIPMYTASFKALGAKPTPINYSEVYVALQQGVVDGMENPSGLIRGMKFYEVAKYMTLLGWSNAVNLLVMNGDAHRRLTPEQQRIVANAGRESSKYLEELMVKEEQENLDFFRKQGMTLITVDQPEAWREKVAGFPKEYGHLWGAPELYGRIQSQK
jgi:TRAP-type transport system periplasmic protein